jgi:hypothetical protein
LKSVFLLVYHQNPKSSKGWSIEKERERERERNIEKEEGKRKALRVSANKNGELIF